MLYMLSSSHTGRGLFRSFGLQGNYSQRRLPHIDDPCFDARPSASSGSAVCTHAAACRRSHAEEYIVDRSRLSAETQRSGPHVWRVLAVFDGERAVAGSAPLQAGRRRERTARLESGAYIRLRANLEHSTWQIKPCLVPFLPVRIYKQLRLNRQPPAQPPQPPQAVAACCSPLVIHRSPPSSTNSPPPAPPPHVVPDDRPREGPHPRPPPRHQYCLISTAAITVTLREHAGRDRQRRDRLEPDRVRQVQALHVGRAYLCPPFGARTGAGAGDQERG